MRAPRLSKTAIVEFFKNGFMSVKKLTTKGDLEGIRALLDGLYERFDELPKELVFDLGDLKYHDGTQRSPQINSATRFEPRLKKTLAFRNARIVARQLLGRDAEFGFDHAIFKAPNNKAATPWHQDMSYGGNVERISWNVAFWIPLQDATVDSGCMQFIRHSHLGPLKEHHRVGHDDKWHTLETDDVDASKAVACPLKAGGATLHMSKTMHYTAPNETDVPRRAWILNFRENLNI